MQKVERCNLQLQRNRYATVRLVQISCGSELTYRRDKMADIVSFNQTNGEPTVSVAIGNDPDVPVVVVKDSATPQPKQPDVITIVNRNVAKVCGWFIISFICLAVAISIISMIVVGSIHLHNCPVEPFIPIWLVVGGVFGLVEAIRQVFRSSGNNDSWEWHGCLMLTFLFAWFIAGSVWFFSVLTKANLYSSDAVNYCHPLPFMFALTLFTSMLGSLAGVIFVFLVICICACLRVAMGK